jgi:hypothetical protein
MISTGGKRARRAVPLIDRPGPSGRNSEDLVKVHEGAGSRLGQNRRSHDCLGKQQTVCAQRATRLGSK